jgi:hypothetical protein
MVEAVWSSDEFVKDAARFAVGTASLEQLAALHGMTPEHALAVISDPTTAARIDRAAADLERDGSALRLRARSLLHEALRRLGDTIDRGECSPAFLLRLSEVMGKLSAQPRDDRKETTGPTFAINIDLGGGNSVSLKGDPLTLDATTGELVANNPSRRWQE